MGRGRKPKPTSLKVFQGNPGKRALPKGEPKPAAGMPVCPEHLDDDARAEWERVVAELGPIGVITRLDLGVLSAYCSTWSHIVQMEKALAGNVAVKKKKELAANRLIAAINVSYRLLLVASSELGLTPVARTRIHSIPVSNENDFKKFLNGKG